MQTAQQTNRLDFLFTAGFQMVSTVPALSRYYMNEFQNSLTEFELSTPKTIDRLACKSCGQISLPGLSSRVEIRTKRKKEKNKKRKNVIENSCKCCGHTRLYHGSYKKKLPHMATVTTTTVPVATIVEKKKKNKGKKNSLKAMLTKSTQQQQQPSNLSDFLSFL